MNYSIIKKSYKIVLLGYSNSGKTSLSMRMIKGIYEERNSTIGAAYSILRHDINYKLEIWDTGGQERFLALVRHYYRDVDLYLLVFDTNNLKTLENIDYFIDEIKMIVEDPGYFIIVGNKIDIVEKEDIEIAEKMIKKKNRKI